MKLKTPILMKAGTLKPRTPLLILSVLAFAVSIVCAAVLIGNRRSSEPGPSGAGGVGQLASYAGQASGIQATEGTEPGWPRKISSGDTTVLFYNPEIEKWEGDQ